MLEVHISHMDQILVLKVQHIPLFTPCSVLERQVNFVNITYNSEELSLTYILVKINK